MSALPTEEEAVSVGETYFFRNADHFRALGESEMREDLYAESGLARASREDRPLLRLATLFDTWR